MSCYRMAASGVLLLILLIGWSTPVAAQEVVRQVTVVGSGEVTAVPDVAEVWIGVETEAPTVQEALETNNAQVAAIIAQIQALGISETDIQTRSFRISPRYDRENRQVTGYVVCNILEVTIRNLEQAGALLDQVVQLGANRIYGINFRVENPEAVLDQARAAAMTDARRKAEQLAQLANAQLGEVLIITENIGTPPTPVVRDAPEAAPATGAVPIEPGEQTFTVQIQVTFELL